MADVVITAANVLKGTGAVTVNTNVAGESVTAGDVVYLKNADSKWWKAQCDGTTEESGGDPAGGIGVCLNSAGAGQPVVVQTGGLITIGGTVVAGTEYVLSAAAGKIAPHADLVSNNKYVRLGYAVTAAILSLDFKVSGVAVP